MDRQRAEELTDKLIAGTITKEEKEEMAKVAYELMPPIDWSEQPGVDEPMLDLSGEE